MAVQNIVRPRPRITLVTPASVHVRASLRRAPWRAPLASPLASPRSPPGALALVSAVVLVSAALLVAFSRERERDARRRA